MPNLLCKLPVLIIVIGLASCSQSPEQLVAEAEKAYEAQDEEKARELYQKAADMGNAEAHFNLAYGFSMSHGERTYHFTEAAKQGHEEGLRHALEYMFFRAGDLTTADPEKALALYSSIKEKYPSITIFNEEVYVATLQKAMEPGPFDAKAFIQRYAIKEDEINTHYGVWELAEEASRGGRFGKPDPKLVLQLISRGGYVPAELEEAIDSAYVNWKGNTIFEFNICNFITSSVGLTYCSIREEEKANKEFEQRINQMATRLKNNTGPELRNAFDIASQFIEEKAAQEEMHGGSGHAMWQARSVVAQKSEYLDLIEKINSRFDRDTIIHIADSSAIMNTTYRKVLTILEKEPLYDFNTELTAKGVASTQKFWVKHRQTSAIFFSRLNPSVSPQQWQNWLTARRMNDFRDILWMTTELR